MPTYEVTRGDRVFEVDAASPQEAGQKADAIAQPQPEAPRQYRAAEVPFAAINRLIPNTAEVVGNIAEHYGQEQPDQTGMPLEQAQPTDVVTRVAKDIAKTGIGMAQEFIPGQQQYETEYADPLYQRMSKSWGFDQPTGRDQWEQIKRNIAERPVEAGLDVSMVTAPFPARSLQTVSRAVNPLSWAGRGTTTVAKRAVTPFPARAANTEAARALREEGVPVTAGQATGSEFLKFEESALGGNRTTALIDAQNEAFTRAASRRIGVNSPHLDGDTMQAAYDRIGGVFDDVARRNVLHSDQQLQRQALNTVRDYANVTSPPMRAPIVEQTLNTIRSISRGPMGGRMDGAAYQNLRSQLGAQARRSAKDPALQDALHGLQRALDDAMERSLRGADRGRLRGARRQYRNWLVLERAMATGGADTAAGILTPAKLEQGLNQIHGRRGYLLQRHEFGGLAKAGKVAMSKMPQSGTIPRLMARAVPAAVGAAAAGLSGGLLPVIGGTAATFLGGRGIMSGPGQAYLRNQALPMRELTRAGRILGATGRVATGVAANKAADARRKKEQQKGPR